MVTFLEFALYGAFFFITTGLFIGWLIFSGIRRRIWIMMKTARDYKVDCWVWRLRNGEWDYSWDYAKAIPSEKGIWKYQLLLSTERDGKHGKSVELKEEPKFIRPKPGNRDFMILFEDAEGMMRHSEMIPNVNVVERVFVDKDEMAKFLEAEATHKKWEELPATEKANTPEPPKPETGPKVFGVDSKVVNATSLLEISTHSEAKNFLGDGINDFVNPRSPRYQNKLRGLLSNVTLWTILICGIVLVGTTIVQNDQYRKNLVAQTSQLTANSKIMASAAAQAVREVMLANQTVYNQAGQQNAAPPDALGGLLNIGK